MLEAIRSDRYQFDMFVTRSISDYRAQIAGYRDAGMSVGLVTTMGALHAGHMALVTRARTASLAVDLLLFPALDCISPGGLGVIRSPVRAVGR